MSKIDEALTFSILNFEDELTAERFISPLRLDLLGRESPFHSMNEPWIPSAEGCALARPPSHAPVARSSRGSSLLEHGNDWAGRAIAAETRVLSLEHELRGEREAYNSLRRDVAWEHQAHEEDLEETIRLLGSAYDSLINCIVLHEPILREYYEERCEELPKERFEKMMHELHQALILRSGAIDDMCHAPDIYAGE
jgi:hypothetical protein